MSDLIIIGGGGHAKVIADIATANGYKILGFLDDNPNISKLLCHSHLGGINDAVKFADKAKFVIAIGNNNVRKTISEKFNLKFATLVHPTAAIGSEVEIGEGSVVMANAVINACAKIGSHCIINTCAVIEHDGIIDDFTHISPNATLCGTVKIGNNCHIGAGATVINNKSICQDCIIGAGAVVTENIETPGTYIGIPMRKIK